MTESNEVRPKDETEKIKAKECQSEVVVIFDRAKGKVDFEVGDNRA